MNRNLPSIPCPAAGETQTAPVAGLRERVRSALHIGRVLVDRVLGIEFSEERPDEYWKLAFKAAGELAMLLRIAARALPDAADLAEIRALARDIIPLARNPRVHRVLLLSPSHAPVHLLTHLLISEFGFGDARFDRIARLALRSPVAGAAERVPYRMLEDAWTRHLAFGDAELAHPALVVSRAATGVDLLDATSRDAYAFTHALLYATDFGRLPLPAGLDAAHLLGTAEALAVRALDDDDLDVLSELVMAAAVLRAGWTPCLEFSWRVIEHVWDRFGFVPGPGIPPEPPQESENQKARRVLGTAYHTTFAAGLCAATLIGCRAIPDAERSVAAPGGMAAPPGRPASWKAVWEDSSRETQEGLAFVALAFGIRRAIENVDLEGLRGLLISKALPELAGHPLIVQCVDMLERAVA